MSHLRVVPSAIEPEPERCQACTPEGCWEYVGKECPCGCHEDSDVTFVESSVGLRDTSIVVDVKYCGRLKFARSALGGPVVQQWPDGRLVFIDNPEQYGDFPSDKLAWVKSYYDDDDDEEHNGCGCSLDSYYDDGEDED